MPPSRRRRNWNSTENYRLLQCPYRRINISCSSSSSSAIFPIKLSFFCHANGLNRCDREKWSHPALHSHKRVNFVCTFFLVWVAGWLVLSCANNFGKWGKEAKINPSWIEVVAAPHHHRQHRARTRTRTTRTECFCHQLPLQGFCRSLDTGGLAIHICGTNNSGRHQSLWGEEMAAC